MFIEGPLTGFVRWVVVWLKKPVEKWIVKPYWAVPAADAERRMRWADCFLIILLALDVGCLVALHFLRTSLLAALPLAFFAWRIIDIVATAARITLFPEAAPDGTVIPMPVPTRAVVYGFIYFFESIVCFGAIYSVFPRHLTVVGLPVGQVPALMDAMHLSFVTAFTIGYGDVYPTGWLRPVTWAQGACSLILVVILVARYVGLLQETGRMSRK